MRDLRWTDIEALSALETELFPADAWLAKTWWSELAGRPRRCYLVEEDESGALAGYAGVDLAGEVADIMTLAVAPSAQGRGVGRRLLEGLVERAAADHAAYVMLEVRADNEPARRLYGARGFGVLNVRRRYYQPGDVDALVMRLALGGVA
ncbi:ribosomal protein S18-alanine N-acetyltransferase [Pedococcus sp. 5OH_020]|uniref:ribosomal protein S18-alanine N-acetyltransferase n=1 Tax=Pedococcus sp. 5OH_020 TaxID=2989814 RepID=UPI0022E9A577|nr:ribosomal protein S18-alanine N-acetyltransferase [Pedococcus sp. 5OH_020]